MSAKSTGQRTFIWIIVIMFAISSLGFTALVIWEMTRSDTADTSQEDIQAQLDQQNQEGKLQGTKLADYEPRSDVTELEKIDIKEGTGKAAKADSTVTAHYTGALAKDGTIFESSKDNGQPATFPLANVIKGWQEGVPGMKEGGIRRLIIPASLAYGEKGSPPTIGPNEPLVFDIELVSVQ